MPRMIPDAELLFDEAGDAAPRPQRPPKAEGFRPLSQQVPKLDTLGWAQFGRGPGGRVVPERRDALQGGTFQPLTHRPLRHAQGFRDAGLRPSHPVQFPGTEAATLLPTSRRGAIGCAHRPGVQHIPAHDY